MECRSLHRISAFSRAIKEGISFRCAGPYRESSPAGSPQTRSFLILGDGRTIQRHACLVHVSNPRGDVILRLNLPGQRRTTSRSGVKPKPQNHPPSWSQTPPPPRKRPSRSQPLWAANSAQNRHSRAGGVHRLSDVRSIGTFAKEASTRARGSRFQSVG